MKIISEKEAKQIIVLGIDKGFSVYSDKENDRRINVYHRVYKEHSYDIAEVEYISELIGEQTSYFYLI